MRAEVGDATYQKLVRGIAYLQSSALVNELSNIEVTGTFISYRKSLLNWCPIGRDSAEIERNAFIEKDLKNDLRKKLISHLRENMSKIDLEKFEIALGGNTSIDIYPRGWNKTYSLNYYNDHKCWFVGDRCEKGGNDEAIYNRLLPLKTAFSVESPQDTVQIILNNIIPAIS